MYTATFRFLVEVRLKRNSELLLEDPDQVASKLEEALSLCPDVHQLIGDGDVKVECVEPAYQPR